MEKVHVVVDNKVYKLDRFSTVEEFVGAFFDDANKEIVLAFLNGKLVELGTILDKDCELKLVSKKSVIGHDTYKRSLTLLMFKAFSDVVGGSQNYKIKVMYSISRGYYCEFSSDENKLTNELLQNVKAKMKELIARDLPIIKESLSTDIAASRFAANGMKDKEKLFKYRRVSKANLYNLDGYEDYFYGYMVSSTKYLNEFDLIMYDEGFVLISPTKDKPNEIPEFVPQEKLFQVFKKSESWANMLGVGTVGDLNETISKGEIGELMLVQEALQEKQIAEIADKILEGGEKIVLIAGPSSSGKTTFSHRLSIQLRAHGLKPYPVALDNYFVDREFTPKDEDGNYDFECIEAMDLKLFNKQMTELLEGKTIEMPRFNFQLGIKEYKGNMMKLNKGDVLVCEGIHALNPLMTEKLPNDSKFKIYISALTQLNVDEHNRIPTTDGRLIRRIVRDARTRGNDAKATIGMWNSVRRGEEKFIFPFQEEANVMFNSALIYELAAIKQFVEPLLFAVPRDCDEYQEAKRLLKFLDYFLGVDITNIPTNSIIREFVGGGCFDV